MRPCWTPVRCAAVPPQRSHASICVGCRGSVGEGISLPLSSGSLAAMRHIVYGDPKRLFSFHLDGAGLETLAGVAEAYLLTQLERGFRTLDFYKSLTLTTPDRS